MASIREWPEGERPREKLLHMGPQALSDAELLAIFLRTGTQGKSAVDLARELIKEFGGLRTLLTANQQSFCACHGLGQAKFATLQAVLEMSRRHMEAVLTRGEALTSSKQVRQLLKLKLRDYPHEVFAVIFLDKQHQVLAIEELFKGTLDAASIYPREVLKRVLHHNAAAVIFAHNHPSGSTRPSQADQQITQSLRTLLQMIDVQVLDHFIIGEGDPYSFAEAGLI
ncbi:DNA repair protein RadC [Allopseudospirillum japonicum]|uniref:DNA repair protein RadC n=1 Tax=Allopseudospirillum japonicum TaxID=64971 RepID=A0A1H6R890_9GAMM|nr:DNA repair protein RadC [Allopseudospirillum japonicum]SEI52108.1 DNA repair protein RadC [Allopseudospirillum japonicum]